MNKIKTLALSENSLNESTYGSSTFDRNQLSGKFL